jgi:hypothetical protein
MGHPQKPSIPESWHRKASGPSDCARAHSEKTRATAGSKIVLVGFHARSEYSTPENQQKTMEKMPG